MEVEDFMLISCARKTARATGRSISLWLKGWHKLYFNVE